MRYFLVITKGTDLILVLYVYCLIERTKQHSTQLVWQGPLNIESLWAKKRISTRALGAQDNPPVV